MNNATTSARIAELEAKAQEIAARLESEDGPSTKAQVQALGDALRDWNPSPNRNGEHRRYADGATSFYNDIRLAKAGDSAAHERLAGRKAMTEGTDSAGGYLVSPEISDEVVRARLAASPVRSLMTSLAVNGDTLQISTQTGGLTAGWVAELATKPQADMTFGQLSVNVFTAAGLGVVSNQLLADSNSARPGVGVDTLITADLAARLAIVEEIAFIDGTGTGQPLGILGTGGVNSIPLTPTDIPSLLDAIVDAIAAVQTNYFGPVTAILMHPRTWTRILKAREGGTSGTYLIGTGANSVGRRGSDALPGGGTIPGLVGDLFGTPVVISANMPTNKGGGTESRIIVGDFSQGLVLDRQGMVVDTSEHVFFTSNQTVFRAESRVGFTAARLPKAFSVISGAGLANG